MAGSLVLVATLTGCSATASTAPGQSLPAPTSGTSTAPTSTVGAETPWQQELHDLQPDGRYSVQTALRLFAMAFGPLPGVDVQPAAPGTVDSASPAIIAVRAHRAELSDAQRQAVDSYLTVPPGTRSIEVPTATSSSPAGQSGAADAAILLARADSVPVMPPSIQLTRGYDDLDAEITDEASRARAEAAIYFGDLPGLQLRLLNVGAPYITSFETTTDGCDVFVNTQSANLDRFVTRRSLTLDVVHCFEAAAIGGLKGPGAAPEWAWTGPAEYINLKIWPPTTDADRQAWSDYLVLPDRPLFQRAADAIGFYAQLQAMAGADLASVFKAVISPGESAERFAAAGAASASFLDDWASGVSRTFWNDHWGFDGPGILMTADATPPRQPMTIVNDATEVVSQPAYSNHLYALSSSADIVLFDVAGYGRVGDGTVDSTDLGPGYFCTTDKGCGKCPDGSDPSIHPARLAPESVLAISGGTDDTTGSVSGHALEEFCNASPAPQGPVQVKDIKDVGGHTITFVDMVACDGPYGHWTGSFFGIENYSRPMDFDMGGGSGDRTVTTTPGVGETPHGVIAVSGDVDVTIKDDATTMVLSGTTDVVYQGPNGPLPPDRHPFSVSYRITPADPGRCP